MQLAGKKIIVTGGARGIGAVIACAYAAEGAQVVVLDVLDDQGVKVVAAINAQHVARALYLSCDIADAEQVRTVFTQACDWLGGLDVLANIAGVERTAPAEEISQADWNLIRDYVSCHIGTHGLAGCDTAGVSLCWRKGSHRYRRCRCADVTGYIRSSYRRRLCANRTGPSADE